MEKKTPIYKKSPGQGKKPMIWRAAKASTGSRARLTKVSLAPVKSLEEKK